MAAELQTTDARRIAAEIFPEGLPRAKPSYFTYRQWRALVLHTGQSLSYRQIARRWECSPQTVSDALRDALEFEPIPHALEPGRWPKKLPTMTRARRAFAYGLPHRRPHHVLDRDWRALVAHVREGLDYRQIAERLGCSLTVASTRVFKGLNAIQQGPDALWRDSPQSRDIMQRFDVENYLDRAGADPTVGEKLEAKLQAAGVEIGTPGEPSSVPRPLLREVLCAAELLYRAGYRPQSEKALPL